MLALSVLHVAQPSHGGVADVVLDLARDQSGRGWRVTVACDPDGWLGQQAAEADVLVAPWLAGRAPGPQTLRETLRLRRLIATVAPDVVVLHSAKAGLCGRLALRGRRPTLFMPHAWSFLAVGGMTDRLARVWERRAAGWAQVLLCVSEAERQAGEQVGVEGSWAVIPNGVDLARWTPSDSPSRAEARAGLGLDAGPLALCIGRLCEQKGQDLLLAAWRQVDLPDARLVLVGDGPDAAELQRTATPGVTFVGHRTDVAEWIAAADVVVAPSRWEGHALVPLQAAARQRCVVAFDVDGMALTLGRDSAALVPPGDTAALAGALRTRLLDTGLRDREALALRRRVETHFDARESRDQVARLVERAAQRQGLEL